LTEKVVNIEAIMQSIRGYVLEEEPTFSAGEPGTKLLGKLLPPEFYEHLHLASRTYDQIYTQLDLGPANVPVLGGIFQTVRRKLHELVLFYVNQMAAKQINVNQHLLRAVNILAGEIESMQEAGELAKR
jgi:hypothetical protein